MILRHNSRTETIQNVKKKKEVFEIWKNGMKAMEFEGSN